MATIDDIEKLGYAVSLVSERVDDDTEKSQRTYRVDGFGISTLVNDDDQGTIASLADQTAHAERKIQSENPELLGQVEAIEASGRVVERELGSADITVDGSPVTKEEIPQFVEDHAAEPASKTPTIDDLVKAVEASDDASGLFKNLKAWASGT